MRLLLVTCLLTLLATACKRDVTPSANTMHVHIINDPGSMQPVNDQSEVQQYISTLTQKTLYQIDLRTLELTPVLVTKLPELKDDSISFSLNLRKDVEWDNGTPFTIHDVVFTIKCYMASLNRNPGYREMYRTVVDSVASGNDLFSGTIVMSAPSVSNPYFFIEMYMIQEDFWDPEHTLRSLSFKDIHEDKYSGEHKAFFEGFNAPDNGLNIERLGGLGPYKFTEWVPDEQVVLEMKKNWWGEHDTSVYNNAYVDKIIFRIIESDQAATEAFKRGELDVTQKLGTEALLDLQKNNEFNKNYHSAFVDQFAYTYIALNTRPEGTSSSIVFADKRVRQALAHLIDVDAFIEVFLHGHGRPQATNISPNKPYYHPHLQHRENSLSIADGLLKKAGWIDRDGDGIREKSINGKTTPFEFRLNYFAENSAYKEMTLLVKDQLAKAGIKVIPNPLESGDLYKAALSHNYDAMFGSWIGDATLNNPLQLWHTSNWANNGHNFTGFGDAESDSLIQVVNACTDYDCYEQAIIAFQEKIYDEQPYIFMYQVQKKVVISKRFENADMYVEKPGIILNNLKPKDN